MKKAALTSLLILIGVVYYINDSFTPEHIEEQERITSTKGLCQQLNQLSDTEYNFEVELDDTNQILSVNQTIIWINKPGDSTNKLYFQLPLNAFKPNAAINERPALSEENKTKFIFELVRVNGGEFELNYPVNFQDRNDSTSTEINLPYSVKKGDTTIIELNYKFNIPEAIKNNGRARGRNFYFFADWFPRLAIFREGKWIKHQFNWSARSSDDYSDYNLILKIPSKYKVITNGITERLSDDRYSIQKIYSRDFVWCATEKIYYHAKEIQFNGNEVVVGIYLQPESEKYSDRYLAVVKATFDELHKIFDEYSQNHLTIIEAPRTFNADNAAYTGLIISSTQIISPVELLQPEMVTAKLVSQQFIDENLITDNQSEAWISEGLSSYIATQVMEHNYPNALMNFKMLNYYPVYGLNFLSYNEIPVVYTIKDLQIPHDAHQIEKYYKNPLIGKLADSSFQFRDESSYEVNTAIKPVLMLQSIKRIFGEEKLNNVFKKILTKYKCKFIPGKELLAEFSEILGNDFNRFVENFFERSAYFDYKIRYLKKVSDTGYELFVERIGDAIFPVDIALYTETDTLYKSWDGIERNELFKLRSDAEILAAEIDPQRKIFMDISYSNNSYTIDTKYWGSISLAVRCFFWFQNALMILGSVG